MRETASTIKTEVLAELNVTRKRLHQIASDFIGCNTLLQVDLPGKDEESHIVPKAVSNRERCFDGVREVFERDESQSNSPVQEGKSDCRRRRSRANMHAFSQRNIGHVFNVNSDTSGRRPRKEVASEGGGQRYLPQFLHFQPD